MQSIMVFQENKVLARYTFNTGISDIHYCITYSNSMAQQPLQEL